MSCSEKQYNFNCKGGIYLSDIRRKQNEHPPPAKEKKSGPVSIEHKSVTADLHL